MDAPIVPAQAASATQAVLDQLHPLLQPAPPAWTPQTPGWLVLMVLALGAALWAGWRLAGLWHARRFRRLALAELRGLRAALSSSEQREEAARRLPALVRQLALAHAPREQVAVLQGAAWSAWLDESLRDPGRPFSQGVGRQLSALAYLPAASLPWPDIDPLVDLIERWVRRHRLPGGRP